LPDVPEITKSAEDYAELTWRDATELWMHIYQLFGRQTDQKILLRKDLIDWLQACQNSDGGFGFLPGTTSFIENCYSSLRALALLGAAPLNPVGCQSFLMSCWTGTGGFARSNRAMAFLYSTWYGIAALELLDNIQKSDF
jgi:prenyltransferase beta subunit